MRGRRTIWSRSGPGCRLPSFSSASGPVNQADRSEVAGGPDRGYVPDVMEKEDSLVVNELWAKVSPRERFVAYGVVAVVVGWLLGTILGSKSYGGTVAGYNFGVTYNYFSWGTAGLLSILALLCGVAGGVVLYLKIAPNMNITWPMPVAQIILGISVAALACGVLTVLFQFTDNLPDPPILIYLADVVLVAGGALMAWGAYQEWLTTKPAV